MLQALRESLNSCLSSMEAPVLSALVQHRAHGSNTQQVLLDSRWPCRKPALSPRGTLCCHSAAAELSLKLLAPTSQLSSKNTAAAKKLSQNKQGEHQHKFTVVDMRLNLPFSFGKDELLLILYLSSPSLHLHELICLPVSLTSKQNKVTFSFFK